MASAPAREKTCAGISATRQFRKTQERCPRAAPTPRRWSARPSRPRRTGPRWKHTSSPRRPSPPAAGRPSQTRCWASTAPPRGRPRNASAARARRGRRRQMMRARRRKRNKRTTTTTPSSRCCASSSRPRSAPWSGGSARRPRRRRSWRPSSRTRRSRRLRRQLRRRRPRASSRPRPRAPRSRPPPRRATGSSRRASRGLCGNQPVRWVLHYVISRQ